MRISLLLCAAAILGFCTGCADDFQDNSSQSEQFYAGTFDAGDASIPFRFYLKDTSLTLVNAEEYIEMLFLSARADTLVFGFPQYHGTFEVYHTNPSGVRGTWIPSESTGKPALPFSAQPADFVQSPRLSLDTTHQFAVHFFSNDSSRSFPAIVKLASKGNELTGTFLTETGDFRFMSGKIAEGKIWLSTFDGDHLYYSTAVLVGDSIKNGLFHSGNKPPYFWSGKQFNDTQEHLAHADSITTIVDNSIGFSFAACTFSGDTVKFDSSSYHNLVTVVTVFGSWCPNCHDELRMYAELAREINHPQLQFVPVAFERGNNISVAEASVKKASSYTGFTQEIYYGGEANKTSAATVFPQLSKIVAFPTSIFIDKKGRVRKIHTGFNGPGTGSRYLEHRQQVSDLLQQLLQE